MSIKVTILGSGTSMGVPMIACNCQTCTSSDSRDKRTRCSALIEVKGKRLLIDATPELRLQCLANHITDIDACLITHTHADHIFGLDDLRGFTKAHQKPLEIWSSTLHFDKLYSIFGYADLKHTAGNKNLPQLIFRSFDPNEPFTVAGITITPLELPHVVANCVARMNTIGFRIDNFAYCTDICRMDQKHIEALKGIDTLVLGVLRHKPHVAHLNIEQAISLSRQIGSRQTYFTHIGHNILHARDQKNLPEGFFLACDGLQIEC
ncbi:MAG: MBL fold metallo-hydrolase [Sedimentisphaerales bacterium]|nr:MBL fold metallo-hydrolase [Sedimentisphaerales bacterium]